MQNNTTKTRTKPLKAKGYIWGSVPTLNLTKLVDDALASLADIRYNGYGKGNQGRSECVIRRSFYAVMVKAGYSQRDAEIYWRDQVRPLNELAVNADE